MKDQHYVLIKVVKYDHTKPLCHGDEVLGYMMGFAQESYSEKVFHIGTVCNDNEYGYTLEVAREELIKTIMRPPVWEGHVTKVVNKILVIHSEDMASPLLMKGWVSDESIWEGPHET